MKLIENQEEVKPKEKEEFENECIYCGTESKYTPLIPKPSFFTWKNKETGMLDNRFLICLDCLEYEINNSIKNDSDKDFVVDRHIQIINEIYEQIPEYEAELRRRDGHHDTD